MPAFSATVEEIYNQAMQDGFTFLPIQNKHIFSYNGILLLKDHRDPFDRLLVATALEENAGILSADEQLRLYIDVVNVIW